MDKNRGIFLIMLGQNIARIRKKKGITQAQLAAQLNMDRSNLRRLEAGRTNPTAATLYRISKVLAVELEDFFDFKETEGNGKNS